MAEETVMILPQSAWKSEGIVTKETEAMLSALKEKPNKIIQANSAQEYLKANPFSKVLNPTDALKYISAVSATPATVSSTSSVLSTGPSQVKTATKDIILFDEAAIPINLMSDLIFEDIGGEELISIARRDTVNGQVISYQPIKNLSSIEQQYNPNNIVSLQATADKYFANFPIKIDDRIPINGTGLNGDYVYVEPTTGNLIIEVVNLEADEQVEIQIATSGTIYEADFSEGVS